MFTSGKYSPLPFKLSTKVNKWEGTFTDSTEVVKTLDLVFGESKSLFGIGMEEIGAYIINGSLDSKSYDVSLVKTYLGHRGF